MDFIIDKQIYNYETSQMMHMTAYAALVTWNSEQFRLKKARRSVLKQFYE